MSTFNNLITARNHYLILRKIFSNLNMRDLQRLRIVNRGFKIAVEEYPFEELELDQDDLTLAKDQRRNWFYTLKSFNNGFLSTLPYLPGDDDEEFNYDLSRFNTSAEHLRKLKRLKLKSFCLNQSIVDRINNLKHLETLELHEIISNDDNDKYRLSLPKLEHFSYPDSKIRLTINAPRLFAVQLHKLGICKFLRPNQITYLKVGAISDSKFAKEINTFDNLECLEIHNLNAYLRLAITRFKRLTKVKIYSASCLALLRYAYQIVGQSSKIEFYYRDIKIKSRPELEFVHTMDWTFKEIRIFHDRIHVNDCLMFVNYHHLLEIPMNFRMNFISKFKNIQILLVCGHVTDPVHLSDFINDCKNLTTIGLIESNLDQHFYDHLPSISSIRYLYIVDRRKIDRNYDFILRMHNLGKFIVNRENILDAVALDKREALNKLVFLINGDRVAISKIRREDGNDYLYNICDTTTSINREGLTYQELVAYYRQLQNRGRGLIITRSRQMNINLNIAHLVRIANNMPNNVF